MIPVVSSGSSSEDEEEDTTEEATLEPIATTTPESSESSTEDTSTMPEITMPTDGQFPTQGQQGQGPMGEGGGTDSTLDQLEDLLGDGTDTAPSGGEMPYLYKHRSGNRERAKELLEAVGLGDRLNHCPTEMSGGQQQRVAVARALMNNPFLLLADEPTGNLDTHSGQELMDLFDKLNQKQGLTIIMVTHDVDVSERAKRIVHMRDGLIEHDQTN